MSSDPTLSIVAFSKAFARQEEVAGLISAKLEPKHNGLGTGTFSVRADDDINQYLQAKGARVVCTYRGRQEMSGPIRQQTVGLQATDLCTYTIEDDWRILVNALAWVVPLPAFHSQGQLAAQALADDAQSISTIGQTTGVAEGYGAYLFDTIAAGGTSLAAETAVKELVRKNIVQRLGRPVTIKPDMARGGDAAAAGKLPVLRFDTIADGIAALLTWAGMGISCYQDGSNGIAVDAYMPPTLPDAVTVGSGIVVSGTATLNGPTATRIVIGGPGDGVSRAWAGVNDVTGIESAYGDVIEVLKDGSSAPLNWPSSLAAAYQVAKFFALRTENASADVTAFLTAMQQAGADGLTAGVPKAGLAVKLAETDSFHYGGPDGVSLGTYVPIEVAPKTDTAPALRLTGQVTGAEIDLDSSGGISASMTVGDRTDDPDQQTADAIAALQQALRRQAARR